jgi:hypothetical protein
LIQTDANELTIHNLAAVADHEREAISERTKAALAGQGARPEDGAIIFKHRGLERLIWSPHTFLTSSAKDNSGRSVRSGRSPHHHHA